MTTNNQYKVIFSITSETPFLEALNITTNETVFYAAQDEVAGILALTAAAPNLTKEEALIHTLKALGVIKESPEIELSQKLSEVEKLIYSQYDKLTQDIFTIVPEITGIYTDIEDIYRAGYNSIMVETDEDSFHIHNYKNDPRFKALIDFDQRVIDELGEESGFRAIEFYRD